MSNYDTSRPLRSAPPTLNRKGNVTVKVVTHDGVITAERAIALYIVKHPTPVAEEFDADPTPYIHYLYQKEESEWDDMDLYTYWNTHPWG